MSSRASDEQEVLVFTPDSGDMALLKHAAEVRRIDVSSFILASAMQAARDGIDPRTHIRLSERDALKLLELLENPPAPTDRMIKAAQRLPK